jgi:SSS family solute:Na+ symporter
MGISGSWMLFTGLLGAWLSAVFLIPKVSELGHNINFLLSANLGHFYNGKVALVLFLQSVYRIHQFAGFGWSQISFGNN